LALNEALKPPWVTVRVNAAEVPLSGFWCDGAQSNIECVTDSNPGCPAGALCRMREPVVVGLAHKNCMSFKVKNVTLVETLDTGFGPGHNNLFVYFAQTPLDNPHAFSIFRATLFPIRYFNGLKEPDVAEIPLDDGDFFAIEEK
jgi:hypothetical protein